MILRTLAIAGLALGLAACSDDPEPLDPSATGGAGGAGSGIAGQPPADSAAYFETVVGDRVFFATDSSQLDGQAQSTLARQAEWLNQYPAVTITIEGHADERGTREYNLALGARRAESARSYLQAQGVDASRIRTVSYGKERPVALGSNPQAWAENRRAVTVVAGAPLG